MKKLYIIGAGTGGEGFLTQRAAELIRDCDVLFSTSQRLSALLGHIRTDIKVCSVGEVPEEIFKSEYEKTGILVSGDTGFFSIAGKLVKKLPEDVTAETICGISSLQYFCSRLGISYENIKVVSLHGRDNSISGAVSYNPKVFVLTGGENKAHMVCKSLMDIGLGHIRATAGENLSMPNERFVAGQVQELEKYTFEDLTVLLFENPNYANCHMPLNDNDFVRGDVPMTKEEVRAITLSKLAVQPSDTVYDIGAGTGSVAVEIARKAYDGCVYAIEHKDKAVERINQNRLKHGAGNLQVIYGSAPDALKKLPKPDKAFIGGSSGNMAEITALLLDKNPDIRLVANAITLESLNEAVNTFEKHGLETEVVCVNTSASKKVGNYHMMNANNPVYIITGREVGASGGRS